MRCISLTGRPSPSILSLVALLLPLVVVACASAPPLLRQELRPAVVERDALALLDQLEQLIDEQRDSEDDRQAAYNAVVELEQDTAEYAFARAAIAGRLAQIRTLGAISLVKEIERYALRSVELDRDFRDGAGRRLLGVLYVRAPSMFLSQGNADKGIALLQELGRERPDLAENHLRLAEAYVETGDSDKAHPHLCRTIHGESQLRADNRRLLVDLVGRAELEPGAACTLGQSAKR